MKELKISSNYVRGIYAERQKELSIDNHVIYFDDILVVYKRGSELFEIDESSADLISISDIIDNMNYMDESDTYEQYSGKDVYLYRCKNNANIIFSAKTYQANYCYEEE